MKTNHSISLQNTTSCCSFEKAAGVEKGSGTPNKTKVATVTRAQVQQIAETKMPDLNAANIESAMRMIEGTARSMGFTVTD